jgi:uncharacterized surface protein with fasciclin (FAS1) repeats
MRTRTTRSFLALGVALTLGIGTAACADSDGSTTATSTTNDTSATTVATTGSSAATTSASGASTTSGASRGASTTSGASTSAPSLDEVKTALENGDLSTLSRAIDAIGIERLIGDKDFTLFAPNNDAFSKLSAKDLADLLANPTELDDVLKHHLVEEKLTAADLEKMTSVKTADGGTLPVSVSGNTIRVGDATIVRADEEAGTGVIHVIDTVLLPSS